MSESSSEEEKKSAADEEQAFEDSNSGEVDQEERDLSEGSAMQSDNAAEDLRDADFSKLAGMVSAAELEKAKLEANEFKDRYMRSLAEFENYKKRAIKERSELLKYQGEKILVDLVEVLDNLGLALKYKDSEPDKVVSGLEMVHKQFVDALAKWEVRAQSTIGQQFDPAKAEALSKIAVDDAPPGTVVQEFKVPYMYKDRLLRPGSVVVAAPKEVEQEEPTADSDEGERQE
jgi:molecular chaperone GrpE